MFLVLYIFFQIVGESFPVSSSGHLIFLQRVYSFCCSSCHDVIVPDGLEDMLHLFTVLVCCFYFFVRLYHYLRLLVTFSHSVFSLVRSVIIIDSIAILSYPFKSYYENFPLWIGFLITALTLYKLRYIHVREPISLEKLSYKQSIVVGVVQACAFLPGVSRFGVTYVACRFQKLSSQDSFFFSFAMAMPLFFAAGVKGAVSFYYDTVKGLHGGDSLSLVVPSIVLATLVSYYSFVMVGSLIRTNRLWYISYYMFGLSFLAALYTWFV